MTTWNQNPNRRSHETLNFNQCPDELNDIYSTDYYWYLRSDAFRSTFLHPLGVLINSISESYKCLDVGCGEGQLAEFVKGIYLGIDGSQEAITKAKETYKDDPSKTFEVQRMESPIIHDPFQVVVFGGILSVLIKPEKRIEFIKSYSKVNPIYFVVYDLQHLDTTEIDKEFERQASITGTANVVGLQEVKKRRKILLYKF